MPPTPEMPATVAVSRPPVRAMLFAASGASVPARDVRRGSLLYQIPVLKWPGGPRGDGSRRVEG